MSAQSLQEVQVGNSPLNLCVLNDRVSVLAMVNLRGGKTVTFWVHPDDLEAALREIKSSRSKRCRSKKPAPQQAS